MVTDGVCACGYVAQYRAESTFITSGVAGNYEKSLENSAASGLSVNPHSDPRAVANLIIDTAILDTVSHLPSLHLHSERGCNMLCAWLYQRTCLYFLLCVQVRAHFISMM